eukprot:1120463-Amphidinium_carterae.1
MARTPLCLATSSVPSIQRNDTILQIGHEYTHGLCFFGERVQAVEPELGNTTTKSFQCISIGHGLRGSLPSISGTVGLLRLWENGLEGHLQLFMAQAFEQQ